MRPVAIDLACCAALFLCHCWIHGCVHALASSGRQLQASDALRGWELREALEQLDRELYDNAPGPERPYIAQLKNPCWATDVDADSGGGGGDSAAGDAVRCLPYALLLGGFQCGAASLFAALSRHPLVAKTRVSRWHFWAESDKSLGGYLEGLAEGAARVVAWPEQLAAVAGPAATAAAASGGGGSATGGAAGVGAGGNGTDGGVEWLRRQQKVILDGSSSTFAFYWSPGFRAHRAFSAAMSPCWSGCQRAQREGPQREQCLEGCFQPAREADRKLASAIGVPYNDVSLPLLISAVYGKRPPKMVVLLRNPVDRLYSAFWKYGHYQDKYGASVEGFTQYVREQLPALRSCMARNGTDTQLSCVLHFESWGLREERLFFHADQILRGVYSAYLETWLKYFDRECLLVLRSEDYFARPLHTLTRVLRFLGLDPAAVALHRRVERLSRLQAGAGAADGEGGGAAAAATRLAQSLLEEPADERLWAEIRRDLTTSRDGRYRANRIAALQAEKGRVRDALQQPAGSTRPPMPAAVRQELAAFYAPYNRRLAELLGSADFIKGWDQ